MSTYFISDLHLGHSNIFSFSPNRFGSNIDQHDRWVIDSINSVVKPRDLLYILGDVAFDLTKLDLLNSIPCQKKLIIGNHDKFPLEVYNKYFVSVHGFQKYKEFWLSHCPIHPAELRGKINIHGHCHNNVIPDSHYINVGVEQLNSIPISLEQIRSYINKLNNIN